MLRNSLRCATLATVAALFCHPVTLASEDWTLRRQDAELDVRVYDRETAQGYREFRGVTEVQSTLGAFVALFRDTERMPEWLYRAEQVITLRASADPDYLPETKGYIRMPVIESLWRFTPRGDGRVQVEFSGYADPGGRLSSGLLSTFQSKLVWQSPYYSLRALLEVIDDPRYQNATFPFVREPGREIAD